MRIFINDIEVRIVEADSKIVKKNYDRVIDEEDFLHKDFFGDVLIKNADAKHVYNFLLILEDKKLKELNKLVFAVDKKEAVNDYVKSHFKIITAGGGVVEKDDKILLIFRNNKWDIPKGKLDPGETVEQGAVREVQEECGVDVALGNHICHTWHTYVRNSKRVLKKTHWYRMDLLDESNLAPQAEENITMVKWMDRSQVDKAMANSFNSIRHVVKKYYKQIESL